MAKYVFITPTISYMGGAQMYIRNKYVFLRDRNWDVVIITASKGKSIVLKDLYQYKDNCFPELRYNCYEFQQKKVHKICSNIIKVIGDTSGEVIIESTCLEESTWAEYVAEMIGAKHILYTLQESNVISNRDFFSFLEFKHKRRELAGITQGSIKQMFAPFKTIDTVLSYSLSAACSNVEENVPIPDIDGLENQNYDKIVGCLSRLDKPFVEQGIVGLIGYCKKYSSLKVGLLLIGGAPVSYIKRIKKITSSVPNLKVVITGYIYPVPTGLLEMCDVLFSSAGSARVCERSGVPTISFDSNDLKPIGILERTTNNSMFRGADEPELDFVNLLEDVIDRKKFNRIESHYNTNPIDYSSHLNFLALSDKTQDYYDVMSIQLVSIKEKNRSRVLNVLGAKFYSFLGAWKSRNAY